MSAIPEMTPSKMFLAARSVPPGNVWTFTFPWVRFSTSFAQRSIWTQGEVAAGGKLAYRSVIVSADRAVPGAIDNARNRTDRSTGKTVFAFTNASLGNGLGIRPHLGGKLPHSTRIGPRAATRFFPSRQRCSPWSVDGGRGIGLTAAVITEMMF